MVRKSCGRSGQLVLRATLCFIGAGFFSGTSLAQAAGQVENAVDDKLSEKKDEGAKASDRATTGEVPKNDTIATPDPQKWRSRAGIEYFTGLSNVRGSRFYADRFWGTGTGPSYPSNVYVRSQNGKGQEAKLAIGIGDNYIRPNAPRDQPVEAWFRSEKGNTRITVGKQWLPYAIEEWITENRWGVRVDQKVGKFGLTGNIYYDDLTNRPMLFFRGNRDVTKSLNVGVTLGGGRGINPGFVQDRGFGLDATYARGGWKLATENLIYTRNSGENFYFNYGQATYEKWGKFRPFLAKFYWRDKLTASGFNGTTLGATYQLTPKLIVKGAVADTSRGNRRWLELQFRDEL